MARGSETETSETVANLSATESALAMIWGEVLQCETLPSAGDDFFELGGDSMTMVLVEARIKEEFSVELPAGAMLGVSTLHGLSNFLETRYGRLVNASPQDFDFDAK